MNIRLLRIFQSVCQTGSITKSAGLLYMTQPAVSLAIKELEAETSLVLFDRLSRRLEITESGKLYLEKVNQLLELFEELERSPAELRKQTVLRIGSCITVACNWLPLIIRDFSAAEPSAHLQSQVCSATQVLSLLHDNEIDLAFYEGLSPGSRWISIPLSQYALTPFCAPDHPLAQKKNVPLDTLMKEKLLLREPGSAIRDVFDSYLRLNHYLSHPITTSSNSQALIAAVAQGLGVSLLPDITVAEAIEKGLVASFTVDGMELKNEFSIIYHRNKAQTSAMKTFISCAQQIPYYD